jgi:hypothetical protein
MSHLLKLGSVELTPISRARATTYNTSSAMFLQLELGSDAASQT